MFRYPVLARAAYALGGLGSGFADNADQVQIMNEILTHSASSNNAFPHLEIRPLLLKFISLLYFAVDRSFEDCFRPFPPSDHRQVAEGMERARVRSSPRLFRQLHHSLQHGEPGPPGHPYWRVDRRRTQSNSFK